jgi:hypothetical protein
MSKTMAEQREQRLQKLYADCQQQVLSQIIGPFGLSTAMFEDKNGGNVTTLHNFSREDDEYVATENDKILHTQSQKVYSEETRAEYEIKTKDNSVSGKNWKGKRDDKIKNGIDEYTGKKVSTDGMIVLGDGRIVRAELDHVVSISEVHSDKKLQLGLGKVVDGKVDVSKIREVVNHDDNLALTNKSLNCSKSDSDLKEWSEAECSAKNGKSNSEQHEVDQESVVTAYDKAKKHINTTGNKALLKKQATELLKTGGKQAMQMGLRQALGVLLTELVNALFNEILALIKHGVEIGKTIFEEIRERLGRIIESVAKKLPDAVSQMFEGGVSGFMSNLLTFLLNNFLSTAKRFVTVIREGLLGLFKAFKMIFFPPANMTKQEALQAGLKILTALVITTVGILLQETIATFMATLPFLKPFADIITPILIGTMTGLLSAFIAYQIDCMFDRFLKNERQLDELIADAERRDKFANELVKLSNSSLENVSNYSKSIAVYQSIGNTLGTAGLAANATLNSLEATVSETSKQVAKSLEAIDFINSSQIEIEGFLKTI